VRQIGQATRRALLAPTRAGKMASPPTPPAELDANRRSSPTGINTYDSATKYDEKNEKYVAENGSGDVEVQHIVQADKLARKLSARQVQMIAIGGTIGTGLFLGTGRSISVGGPGSTLIAYIIVGCIVFITMLSLGEMATFMPIAGSFCTYAGRFVDDAFAFSLTWNYWFNDAVSMASDLTALQLVFAYWNTNFPGWGLGLIFWVVLVLANIITVAAYGELEYWLSLLKVITIIIFIVLGIAVNAGGNSTHHYIGGSLWNIGDAPFVGGIGGFASVFVTASFACMSTFSLMLQY
jgi:AAT family amino acid transporter